MPMCCSLPSPDFISILKVEPPSIVVAMCSVLSPVLYGHKPWSHLPSSPPSDSSGYTGWAQFCRRLCGNLNQVVNVLRRLWEAVRTYDAVVCVAFNFSLLGKIWAIARQGLSQCHLLHIFFSFTYLPCSFFLSGDIRLYHPWWARDFPKWQLIHCLFQDIFALGQYFLCYQEIKFGKESEAAPKGLWTVCLSVCGWWFFFFFLVSYFFLLLFSVGLTCEGLVLTESHSSG